MDIKEKEHDGTGLSSRLVATTSKHAPWGSTCILGFHLCHPCDFGGFTILPSGHHLNSVAMRVACLELLVSNRIVVLLLFLRTKLGGMVCRSQFYTSQDITVEVLISKHHHVT